MCGARDGWTHEPRSVREARSYRGHAHLDIPDDASAVSRRRENRLLNVSASSTKFEKSAAFHQRPNHHNCAPDEAPSPPAEEHERQRQASRGNKWYRDGFSCMKIAKAGTRCGKRAPNVGITGGRGLGGESGSVKASVSANAAAVGAVASRYRLLRLLAGIGQLVTLSHPAFTAKCRTLLWCRTVRNDIHTSCRR